MRPDLLPLALAFSSEELEAILLTLKVASVATLATLPVGIALGWLLARKRFPGRALLDGLVHLPLVLPPVVTGYLLLVALGRQGWMGAWLADHLGIVFSFRWTGAALASAVMGLPLMVRAIRLAIESVDRRYEHAAATLGSSPVVTFFTITLPLAAPGIVAGAVLCFAKALGEFGATITFVSAIPGETQTLAAALYALTQTPGADSAAWRLTLVAIAVSIAALMASEWLARRVARQVRGGL